MTKDMNKLEEAFMNDEITEEEYNEKYEEIETEYEESSAEIEEDYEEE